MVREGKKGDSTYRAPQKAFPVNYKGVLKEINSRRNMFCRKIKKIAL